MSEPESQPVEPPTPGPSFQFSLWTLLLLFVVLKLLEIGGCDDSTIGDFLKPRRRPNWTNIAALAVWVLSVGMLLTHAVRTRNKSPMPPPM